MLLLLLFDLIGSMFECCMVFGLFGVLDVLVFVYLFDGYVCLLLVIVYLYGGGFVCGVVKEFEVVYWLFVIYFGCVLILIDYCFVLEMVFFGVIEDCYVVFVWVFCYVDIFGIDVVWIGVVGESVGGGLVVVLVLLVCDCGEFLFVF